MEIALFLVRLWQRRLLIGIGLLGSVAVVFAIGAAPAQSGAVAWSRVMLDTRESQLVVADPESAATITWRAEIITHVMTTSDMTAKLTNRAGLPEGSLKVAEPRLNVPLVRSSLGFAASQAADVGDPPYTLQVEMDESLPLIFLWATAPTGDEARRLAQAALDELEASSIRGGRYDSPIVTAGEGKGTLEPLSIRQVSPLREETIVVSRGYVPAIAVAAFLFLVWCTSVAIGPQLVGAAVGRFRAA
jgi:hypothetical protein